MVYAHRLPDNGVLGIAGQEPMGLSLDHDVDVDAQVGAANPVDKDDITSSRIFPKVKSVGLNSKRRARSLSS